MNKRCYIFFITLAILPGCKSKQEKIRPVEEKITESVYASGIVKSNHQYKVYPTVNGIVANILVKEGDTLHKGDAIMQLVNTNARLVTENAELSAGFTAVNTNAEKLEELRVNTALAQSKMDADALLQQRQQNLYNENIGTKNELEQRQLNYKTSRSAYTAAKLRFVQLQKQIAFQDKQSRTNLKIASTNANDYTIKSNVGGKVYDIMLKPGEMVNTQTPVAIIGDADDFVMELQVDEYDINKVKAGQKIVLGMDSYKGQLFEAVVTKIDPIMNDKSKSFTIEAAFLKRPATMYPSLTCEANIVIQEKAKAITIPREYLLVGDSVMLAKGEKRKVVVGLKDYQKAEIISGITLADDIYIPTP